MKETGNRYTRYFQTPRIVDDEGERFKEWVPPRYGNPSERLYVIRQNDLDRPDSIAHKTLGNDRLWWMILDYNKINDPMSLRDGDKLRIPLWSVPPINSPVEVVQDDELDLPDRIPIINYPPFQDPDAQDLSNGVDGSTDQDIPDSSPKVILNFGFPVPRCFNGLVHFQLQAADDPAFQRVVLSRMSNASTTRWYFYDPSANNGGGGYVGFPDDGIDAGVYSGQTIYYSILESELESDNEYYFRYRVWRNEDTVGWTESDWYAPPAIILP